MFQPSKQLQAWTLLVQDGSPTSIEAAKKIQEAISIELREAWVQGLLCAFETPTKPRAFPVSADEEASIKAGLLKGLERPARPIKPDPEQDKDPVKPAPVQVTPKEPVRQRVSVLTPGPEKTVVKAEPPALGKPIPKYYKGKAALVDAKLLRERLRSLAEQVGVARNALIVNQMGFKNAGAIANLLKTQHTTVETSYAQYFAEVLGQDILIP